MKASVSLLAGDHFAFAVMQPGCFLDTTGAAPLTRLVLEGYWRYLDESDPDPTSTGLIRLFVSPPEIVDYVCNAPAWDPGGPPGDPRPAPAVRAAFTGATGNGVNAPGSATHGELAASPQEPAQRRGKDRPSSWAPARGDARAATTAGSPGTPPRGPSWPPSSAPTTSRSTSASPRTRSRSSSTRGSSRAPSRGSTAPAGSRTTPTPSCSRTAGSAMARSFRGSRTCWSSSTRGRTCPPGSTARARTSSSR